eukprot:COSAG02_NODE_1063_length_14846_cov_134.162745_3_plen_85_part_00
MWGDDNVILRSGCTNHSINPRLFTPTHCTRARAAGAREDSDSPRQFGSSGTITLFWLQAPGQPKSPQSDSKGNSGGFADQGDLG